MPSPERFKQLQVAAAFCLFDKKLSSSGKSSIIWGALNLLIGAIALAAMSLWGIVSIVLGLALVIEGIYERKVRDPKVILISAGTLAGLALWHCVLIGLAATGKLDLALGGRTLYWAIAQAVGAYATWKTYSTYKSLRAESDPLTVEQVRGYIEELKGAKPNQSVHLIEFDANAGFIKGTQRYRLMPIEDLFMAVRYKVQLGRLYLEEVAFVPRNEVLLTTEGEKWMSRKMKGTVQLGPATIKKVTISPEMAMRLNPAAATVST